MVQQSKLRYARKSARLVVTVSVVYSICWIPNLVVYVFSSFSTQQLYSAVHTTSIVLVTFNSAINPVLYSWQSDRFRRHMLALLPFGCSTRQCRVSPAIMSKGNATSKASRPMQITPLVSRGPVAWTFQHSKTHGDPWPMLRMTRRLILSTVFFLKSIFGSWEERWSPFNEDLDCETNSPCQYIRKFREQYRE